MNRAPVYIDDTLQIDFDNLELRVSGQGIPITPTEARVLMVFLKHPGTYVTVRQMIPRLWPRSRPHRPVAAVKVHISRLRRKMEADPKRPRYIVSRRSLFDNATEICSRLVRCVKAEQRVSQPVRCFVWPEKEPTLQQPYGQSVERKGLT